MNAQDILQQLQTLDVNDPGAWPGWARTATVIVFSLVVLVAGLWFVINPVYEDIKKAEAQEQQLRTDIDTKQRKVAALDAYRDQLVEMERQFGDMLKQLPSRAEVANLLNDISQKRVEANLEEELFQPQPEAPKEFYAAIPNKVVLVGSYHQIAGFVSAVAALPRIVTVDEFDIRSAAPGSGNAKPSAHTDDTQLRLTATAQTYRYLDDDEIEAAKPKPAAARRR